MTLILTVNGPETIWLLADRRLSAAGRTLRDDARKIMFLQTNDGTAILGYAGLGATAFGTEPADWMSAVLRTRNLPLEQSLAVLADALKRQFPRHLVGIAGTGSVAHNVVVPAFLGRETRLYSIDLVFAPDRKSCAFRCTRHVVEKPGLANPRTPRIGVAGSGLQYLARDKKWMRRLLRMVRANDRGQVPARAVADHLASLNNEVHLGMADRSVGPRCIVAWRHRTGGVHKIGGAHEFYTGTTRDAGSPGLPEIAANGMDVDALCNALQPHFMKRVEAMLAGRRAPELDKDEINAELARLPNKPDENLR